MRLPPGVLDLVLAQHGVVARRQLLRLLGAGAVDGYSRRGFLVRVERGVYRSRLTPVTPQARDGRGAAGRCRRAATFLAWHRRGSCDPRARANDAP